MDNSKEMQRRQGREAWLCELLKANRLEDAHAYARKHGLTLPIGGAGVSGPAGVGNHNPSTPSRFFSHIAETVPNAACATPSHSAPAVTLYPENTADVIENARRDLAASIPPLPPVDNSEAIAAQGRSIIERTGPVQPEYLPIPDVRLAEPVLPEGVERVKVMNPMRNRNQWLVSQRDGTRRILWASYREGKKLKVGRLVAAKVNPDAVQGGLVVWKA